MATVQQLVDAAWRKIGFRDNVAADDAEALTALNNMVSDWGLEFLAPYRVRETFTVTSSTGSYTFGSGGTMDSARPNLIVSCSLKNSDGYTTPLETINGKEYEDIYYKAQSGRPEQIYYIPEYPLGKVIFDRTPDATYTLEIESEKHITEFTALTDTVLLPNEYKQALIYNLALALAEDKGVQLPQTVLKTAEDGKYLISRLISANNPPPEAKFDFATREAFDITTGE